MLAHSGDIHDRSVKWFKSTAILRVFGPQFLGGVAPEFLDLHYKIQPDSDQVAKFQGDRSRDLGERVVKKENITDKI